MNDLGRHIWLRVRYGIETLAAGPAVWNEPALVRKALGELLGVVPATHVQIDLAGFLDAAEPGQWSALLRREGRWQELLGEQAQAIASAVPAPITWGLGLPGVGEVAAAAGDPSERGLIKAGVLLASALQAFRSASLTFIVVPVPAADAGADRARAPVFRNGEMYGWTRATCVPDLTAATSRGAGVDIALVERASVAELGPCWARGDWIGGGLTAAHWNGEALADHAPSCFLLFGEIPAGATPRALVETGRMLRAWANPSAG